MLSKEIKKMKKYFNECIQKDTIYEEDLTLNYMQIAKKYMSQLETREQKLTEKLENRIKELNNKSGGNTFHVQSIINAKKRENEEILKILNSFNLSVQELQAINEKVKELGRSDE